MSMISLILFVGAIVVICIYLFPALGYIDDEDVEFTLGDLIFLIIAVVYFVWFVCAYARTYLG